jgi:hypothetical protein
MEITKYINFIKLNKPFVFAKFGDGEYNAALNFRGSNCDGTPYSNKLGNGIIQAFKYLSEFDNAYIGKWPGNVSEYFKSLVDKTINWADYNIFIFRNLEQFKNEQFAFFKAVKESNREKIYVCNNSMVNNSKELLNIDKHIVIDSINWFESNYNTTLNELKNSVKDPNNLLILTSAGMGAKILIADLKKIYPNAIIIDLGSAMDLVFGNRKTRDFHYNFSNNDISTIYNLLKS